jgi:hypothetical protein
MEERRILRVKLLHLTPRFYVAAALALAKIADLHPVLAD